MKNAKKTWLLSLLLLLAAPGSAVGQRIVLGQRAPEIKAAAWLDGEQPRAEGPTYVEFFHSSNPGCLKSLDRLQALTNKYGTKLHVVVLSREEKEKVARLLAPYRSRTTHIGVDPTGRTFEAFGVEYVPFGMLLDAKHRAVWMGNSLKLNEKIIDSVLR